MSFLPGYYGGGVKGKRSFRTGLIGSDSTGANVVTGKNQSVDNQKTGRPIRKPTGRWG